MIKSAVWGVHPINVLCSDQSLVRACVRMCSLQTYVLTPISKLELSLHNVVRCRAVLYGKPLFGCVVRCSCPEKGYITRILNSTVCVSSKRLCYPKFVHIKCILNHLSRIVFHNCITQSSFALTCLNQKIRE